MYVRLGVILISGDIAVRTGRLDYLTATPEGPCGIPSLGAWRGHLRGGTQNWEPTAVQPGQEEETPLPVDYSSRTGDMNWGGS